ncbi:hypothetical protein EF918_35010, partial [Streptomyces sp. WAC06614]
MAVVPAGAGAVFAAGMVPLPVHCVALAAGAGVESVTGPAHVQLNTALAVHLAAVAPAYRRRRAGRCPRCGHA